MTGTTALICPKCRGEMRTYERNGVLVDQCEECRGIFLDRGELERLLDAERGGEPRAVHSESHHNDRHRHDDDEDAHPHGRRRTSATSFLSDLLGGGE